MIKAWGISLVSFLFVGSASAQSSVAGGAFPTIDHSASITEKLEYGLYYFGAFPLLDFKSDEVKYKSQFLLFYAEQGLTYNFNKKLSISGSYVFQQENVNQSNYINENRVHIQATYKHINNGYNFKHRLRFDNRFVKNRLTGEIPYTHRLRYLFGSDFALKKKKDRLYFTFYEEAFFNTFKGAGSFFGENWAYAAIGMKINSKNKVETGPLYITWNTGNKSWFHQYYIQLTWISKLDFVKKVKD